MRASMSVRFSDTVLAFGGVIAGLALFVSSAAALENAALSSRGAKIEITGTSMNERWNKPSAMLNEERPAGPILNELEKAVIEISLPIRMNVVKVGLVQAEYRKAFALAREVEISAPGVAPKTVTLEPQPNRAQVFDFKANTDRVTVRVKTITPSEEVGNRYGGFNQIQLLVSDDLNELYSAPAWYRPAPPHVMLTPNLLEDRGVKVIGEPRRATAHPKTIWDAQDIAELKRQIATVPAAKAAYDRLIAFCEQSVAKPIPVPVEKDDGVNPALASAHSAAATGIANLGMGYALSGNEAYAREARRMLLELAERFEGWPVTGHPSFTHDSSKWSWQRLNDAIWLIPAAWGFDLIHNSPSLSDADRAAIRDRFIVPCAKGILRSEGILAAATNWSVIAAAAVMTAGRVADDAALYEKARDGIARGRGRAGGVFWHIDNAITDDGLWVEGAIGYQFMAMRGLLVMAEILWRDGVDLYGYKNGRLKAVFDSPIWYSYPGGRDAPAIGDTGGASLFGRDAHLYQYAYRRYGDKAYNAILAVASKTLDSQNNLFLPAFDFAPVDPTDLPRTPSILFRDVGYAILRAGDADTSKYLLLKYGQAQSHSHPDQLSLNLFGLGQELFADGGSAWYSTEIYRRYYSQTLAHNTVVANGQNHIKAAAELEAYGALGTLGIVRGRNAKAIPSAILDRTVLLADDRVYDVFLAASRIPYTYDLPYHGFGELEQRFATAPWRDHPADLAGYAYFSEPLHAAHPDDWQAAWTVRGGQLRLHYLGAPGTELVVAKTPKGGAMLPTVMPRRTAAETVFAGVADLVPAGAEGSVRGVKAVSVEGGRGYAVRVELAGGAYEQLMVNYGDGALRCGDWTSDARTAFVRVADGKLDAFLLAGGTRIEGPAGAVTMSAPSLVAYRAVRDGLAELANLSEAPVEVIQAKGIAAYDNVHDMAADGSRAGRRSDGRWLLGPRMRQELTRGAQPTVAEHEAAVRREKRAAEAERTRRERVAREQAYAAVLEQAKAAGVPSGYFTLIQAEAPVEQEGGKVSPTNRVGDFGGSFTQWNDRGHFLHYEFEVAHDGWYQVALKYCREGDAGERAIRIDGEYPDPAFAAVTLAGTGGWSRGADNWEIAGVNDPLLGRPALVKLAAGRHRLTLENLTGDGGCNVDYVVVAEPFMTVTRSAVEK